MPILAVLCDGKRFLFYKFVDEPSANGSPQISLGQFPNGLREIGLLMGGESDRQYFYRHIRRACEAFYYLFLSGYEAGLEAYWNRSVKEGQAHGKGRDSTPRWYNSKVQATIALEEAVSAWNLYEEGKIEESEKSRERAVQVLAERYVSRCPSLVAVNANKEFLIIALSKLLFRKEVIFSICPISKFPIPMKRWRNE